LNFNGYTPNQFTRFGGLVQAEDSTVLPIGVAAVCKNCKFYLTTVGTRYGLQTAIQGPNQVPVTGLFSSIYTPENPGETLFQAPIVFDAAGFLMREYPTGSGKLQRITGPLVTPTVGAHGIMTEAYNRVFTAYSNLLNPLAPISVYGLNTLSVDSLGNTIPNSGRAYLDPYGQKPLYAPWLASTAYLVGEYVTPTATGGNGHSYRCMVAGTTSGGEPTWPLTEGGTVSDGGVSWKEETVVLANRLPAPNSPQLTRVSSGGTFPAGRDVYVMLTFMNVQGQTTPGPSAMISNTLLNDGVTVGGYSPQSTPGWVRDLPSDYFITEVMIYEADVPTGDAAPSSASYGYVTSVAFFTPYTITATATGAAPPTANTARVTPGGLQPPATPTVERASGAGSFAAGRDVYVIATFTNSTGETLPSVAGSLIDTVLNDAVQVPIPSTLYQITGVNLYECDVATGSPAPATSSYALVGSFQPLSTATITTAASGSPPPATNTSGAAGNIAPDTASDNDTGVQGLRYASIAFTNRNGNLSGTVPAFTSIFVDVPGYELYMANIPIGPSNTINRTIGLTVADGTNAGPFFYIPSATVSSGIPMTSTVIYDNTTTTAFFNFTDEFLEGETSTDMTDRLRCIQPPQAVDVYYSPSTDRIVLTGVNGYGSGHYISLAADSESYYGDTSPIQVANGNGQLCICAREFQGTLYSLKERSGFTISPGPSDPSTWNVTQRWGGEDGVGPCGPRAVCVTNDFLFFVHRSGGYAYSPGDSQPALMTAEMPDQPGTIWSQINWDAQQTIWCCADEEKKELRIGIPVGTSTVPNQTLTMNYAHGIQGPVHFTTQDGNEKFLAGARQWSIDDIAGNLAVKVERKLPTLGSPFGTMRQSQVLIASSAPDGTVQQIQMGVFNDNQQGIDCRYRTVSVSNGLSVDQLGGVSINATGAGAMKVAVMVGRSGDDSPGVGNQGIPQTRAIVLPDMKLTPERWTGYDAGVRGEADEWYGLELTNGKTADAYFSVKYAAIWSRPLFSGRSGSGH
jgi:hypothetical protein